MVWVWARLRGSKVSALSLPRTFNPLLNENDCLSGHAKIRMINICFKMYKLKEMMY